MMKIDQLLSNYGESHKNATNKVIHWICIPAIMFSLFGLLYSIPFPGGRGLLTNWAAVVLAFALLYYLRLSLAMFLGFLIIGMAILWGNNALFGYVNGNLSSFIQYSAGIFVVAWIFQFIGHKIEGKKPSFFKDVQYLLIGPAWLLHFIFSKVGIKY